MSGVSLALKVDMDTRLGAVEGVPRLKEIFKARGISASFFLSLGPDNSGRAVWRLLTRPGFLAKMIRTRAPAAYGLKTLFYGTLLPAPVIGQGLERLIKGLVADGHEVGLHAWNHVAWHDRLWKMPPLQVRAEVARGVVAFKNLVGSKPEGFAAPAWRINAEATTALTEEGLTYMSSTRGAAPYWPCFAGRKFDLLEIPTTMPTADEILGREGVRPSNLAAYFVEQIEQPGLHVLTVHAEMEGRGLAHVLEDLLDACRSMGIGFVRLIDVANQVLSFPKEIPTAEVIRAELPGRPGAVSAQAL